MLQLSIDSIKSRSSTVDFSLLSREQAAYCSQYLNLIACEQNARIYNKRYNTVGIFCALLYRIPNRSDFSTETLPWRSYKLTLKCCYFIYCSFYIGCPTTYQTRHFFNNSKTNEDIPTKQTHTTDTFLFISHTTNVLLFKPRCYIFIGFRIIKEMPGLVGSGTLCIYKEW